MAVRRFPLAASSRTYTASGSIFYLKNAALVGFSLSASAASAMATLFESSSSTPSASAERVTLLANTLTTISAHLPWPIEISGACGLYLTLSGTGASAVVTWDV